METSRVDSLRSLIDNTAISACTLMSDAEREAFFEYQEERERNSECAQKKVKTGRYYYKGEKKGELREVYHVDGREFQRLWKLCEPYIYKSSFRSCHDMPAEIEDAVSEIKLSLFNNLRFFGPRPCGMNFSAYLKLNINNILTNFANARKNRNKSQVTYGTMSLFDELSSDSEGVVTLLDTLKSSEENLGELFSKIPNQYKDAVSMLLDGEKLTDVAKISHISKKTLVNVVCECVL